MDNQHPVLPRLLVDWGETPRVGHQVRPEFSLICPAFPSAPEISVRVDPALDHDPDDSRRRPQIETDGVWTFHVPFQMTTCEHDCRPGHYLIDVHIAFRDVPPELPRFYRSRIRLNVNHGDSKNSNVLEIDGDGQSIINLQGYDLKQFSKVVLRAGQDGIVNLQNSVLAPQLESPSPSEKPVSTFEYSLKVDSQKQGRLPNVFAPSKPRSYMDSAGFYFEDGRRTIVLARSKISFGRSRDNDVVIRFLPSDETNDGHSRNISRTHFVAELCEGGIELTDESKSGMEVRYSVVKGHTVIPASYAGETTVVELGVTGVVPKKFELGMTAFAPAKHEHVEELESWDELYCEIAGGRRSRMNRHALDAGINAVRYDRVTNLAGQESYVQLFREALIGGSPTQAAILLDQAGSIVPARLLHIDRSFWLERLPSPQTVKVDGHELAPRSLCPLSPGMEIDFGNEVVTFDRPKQLYLD